MNKRAKRIKTFFTVFVVILCFAFSACNGCGCESGGDYKDAFKVYDCFSVNYLDVGEGDAIFINFNDGKTLLIDCGEKNKLNYDTVMRYLNAYCQDKDNYLLLTHPDSDHVGNAADILENYNVKTAFVPYLLQPENFTAYYAAYKKLKDGEVKILYSETGRTICGEGYYLIMLSPNAKGTNFSAYSEINSLLEPSANARNDVSPIIYLNYKGVKFIFTGDAGFSQEEVAADNVKTGIIDRYLKSAGKERIDFSDIDFLKVSHHGSADASGEEFLQTITPKNAVVSVSGDNRYGHPSQDALDRILSANKDCNIYLTSVEGTVSVLVDGSGTVTVKTEKSVNNATNAA